jgi:translocation and assembly module TamA
VAIDDDPAHPEQTPVKVQVTEFPAQRIRAGVGYSTDTGAQVEGRYSHYNVFNKAYVFDSQLRLEQKRQYGVLSLAMPPDEKAFVNSINSSYDRTKLEGIDLRSQQVGFKRARNSENYDTTYSLTYYRDELSQEDGSTLPANTIVTPGKHRALVPGFAWSRRNVDDPIFPRKGNLLTLEAGFALKGLLTDQSFSRLYGRFKQFVPVGRRDIVVLRAELGRVFTAGRAGAVPPSLLFRTGGNDSVRGYSYQSIGNEQNGTVYPTKYLAVGSSEYQRWFSEKLGCGGVLRHGCGGRQLEQQDLLSRRRYRRALAQSGRHAQPGPGLWHPEAPDQAAHLAGHRLLAWPGPGRLTMN